MYVFPLSNKTVHVLVTNTMLFLIRRNHEDLNLFSIILNQEIRKLARQVILSSILLSHVRKAFVDVFKKT